MRKYAEKKSKQAKLAEILKSMEKQAASQSLSQTQSDN